MTLNTLTLGSTYLTIPLNQSLSSLIFSSKHIEVWMCVCVCYHKCVLSPNIHTSDVNSSTTSGVSVCWLLRFGSIRWLNLIDRVKMRFKASVEFIRTESIIWTSHKIRPQQFYEFEDIDVCIKAQLCVCVLHWYEHHLRWDKVRQVYHA